MPNWNNLSTDERREYMQIQTAHGGGKSAYLPDDCSECPSCGQPTLGYGKCQDCLRRLRQLWSKLKGE